MRRLAVCLVIAATAVGWAPALRAQGLIRLAPGRGQVGFGFSGNWRKNIGRNSAFAAGYREWVRVPFTGSILHPRLLSYNFSVQPSFGQQSAARDRDDSSSRLLGLSYSSVLLSGQPISLSVSGGRSRGTTTTESFNTEFTTSSFRSRLAFRNQPFPASLTYSRRALTRDWQLGTTIPFTQDLVTRTLDLSARSTKTVVGVSRVLADDRSGEAGFSSWRAHANHRLRWGKGSSLVSQWNRSDRAGLAPYGTTTWSERLHLQHTRDIGSEYRFERVAVSSGERSRRTASWSGGLDYRVTDWLSTGADLFRQGTRLDQGHLTRYGASSRVALTVRPTPGISVGLGGSLGLQRQTQDLPPASFVDVVDESRLVDDTRRFLLDRGEIDPVSVVIRSVDQTLVYLIGPDYEVAEAGPFVEVTVPPGSRIEAGETVLVSYRFRPLTPSDGGSLVGSWNAALGIAGFSLSHSQLIRRVDDNGAGALGPADLNETRTRLRTTRRTRFGRLSLDAGRHRRESALFEFTTYNWRLTLALPPGRRHQISLATGGSRSTSRGDIASTVITASTSTTWQALRNLRVLGTVRLWNSTRDGSFDRSVGGDLNLEWRIGSTRATLRYRINHRRTAPTNTTLNLLSVQAVRRF